MTPLQRLRRQYAISLVVLLALAIGAVIGAFFAGAAVGTEFGLSAIFHFRGV